MSEPNILRFKEKKSDDLLLINVEGIDYIRYNPEKHRSSRGEYTIKMKGGYILSGSLGEGSVASLKNWNLK